MMRLVSSAQVMHVKAQAQSLMEMSDGEGITAGPTFEYVEPELRR
jgi:hypothetical protein